MSLTIIIPVHEFNESVSKYLTTAIKSIERQLAEGEFPEVLVVFPTKVATEVASFIDTFQVPFKISKLENQGLSTFQGQINLAAKNIKTDYFSILEFDDEMSEKYFYNFKKYASIYPDVELFLPVIVETNESNQALKLTNEPVWSKQFVGENGVIGYMNVKALAQFTDFKLSGGMFKTSEFISNGMFKTKIELSFSYEYFLRSINNGGKIFVIPKTIYKHVATRSDSLFGKYATTLSIQERKFWFEVAKKESNFSSDRDIDLSSLAEKQVSLVQ